MNPAQLGAWVKTHKPQAAAGGLVGVAGVATLIRRRKAAAAGSTAASPAAGYGTTGGSLAGATTTSGTAYDSSANDVYNSVQGVLEQLQNTASKINDGPQYATLPPVTTPTPVSYQIGVATQIDEQSALAAGIPKSWLYRTSNPNEGQANYASPTDLAPMGAPGANSMYFGLANKVAPDSAEKVYGADRTASAQAIAAWAAQHVTAGAT